MNNQSVPSALGITEQRSNELFNSLKEAYDSSITEDSRKSDTMKLALSLTKDPAEVAMLCFFLGEMWSGMEQQEAVEGIVIIAQQDPGPDYMDLSAN